MDFTVVVMVVVFLNGKETRILVTLFFFSMKKLHQATQVLRLRNHNNKNPTKKLCFAIFHI